MRRCAAILLGMMLLAWPAAKSSAFLIRVVSGNTATQSLTGVGLSASTYPTGASAGTVIGAVSVTISPSAPSFSGTLTLTGAAAADFSLSSATLPANLITNSNTPTCASSNTTYNINIVATQGGTRGSPFTQTETITCNPPSSDPTIGLLPTDRDAYANWTMAGLQKLPFTSTLNSAGVLNVTAANNGELGPNQTVSGSGIPGGTTITSQLTTTASGGAMGGTGTYQTNSSGTTISSEAMTANGIPARATQCGSTVTPTGVDPTDANNITAAINACTPGEYVKLGAGTFTINDCDQVFVKIPVTVRGAGPCAASETETPYGYPYTPSPAGCTLVQRTDGAYIGSFSVQGTIASNVLTVTANNSAPYAGVAGSQGTIPTIGGGGVATVYIQGSGITPGDTIQSGSGSTYTITPPPGGSQPNITSPVTIIGIWTVSGGSCLSPHFLLGPNLFDNSLNTTSLLATDAQPGSSTVQVANTSGFSVGQQVLLAEHGNFGWQTDWAYGGQVWAAPDFRMVSSSHYPHQASDQYNATPPAAPTIPSFFCFGNGVNCDFYINEIKQIASIGAGPCPGTSCTVTFDSPVMIAYRTASPYNAQLGNFTQTWSTYVGLENMTLQNADYSQVRLLACAYCWVKNVEDTITSNGSIWMNTDFRDQVEEVYDHKAAQPFIGGEAYFWQFDTGSSEMLMQNSVSMLTDKVMAMRESGGGSVIAYNYLDDGFCADGGCGDYGTAGFVSIESGANASHWLGTHHVLFEGNWAFNTSGDGSWGTAPMNTWFRNYAAGARTKFTDYIYNSVIDDINNIPGGNAPLRAASTSFGYYWNSYIGNVLGISGKTTSANGWTYLNYIGSVNKGIFSLGAQLGNSGGNNGDPEVLCDISTMAGATACGLGSAVSAAAACIDYSGTDKCPAIRNINYDYLNNAVEYDPNNSDHTLPNSFFLSRSPAFFSNGSGYTWPWTTPQGSPQLQVGPTTSACTSNPLVSGPCNGLPAKARIDNGTPFAQP